MQTTLAIEVSVLRWLILKNRKGEARTVLTKVFHRDENSVDEDIKNIKSTLPSSTIKGLAVECKIIFKWKNFEEVRRSILDLVVENKLILYSTESYLGVYYLFWCQHLEIMFSK